MAFEKVWLSSPTMHGGELKYVTEAYETNWMSTVGANINEVEKQMCEKVGCKYAVALSAGTASLHLAVKLAGVKSGDKVFCSDMTFDATVNPVVYEGGVPIFIDTEYDTWNMDPVALEKAFEIYPDVKVVVIAHLYGTPGKIDEIKAICNKHGAVIVEDAAESLGATYKGQQTGTFGSFNCISFNGNKIITGSSGGMLLTDSEWAANKARKWSTQSRENAPWYQHEELGYNYRMSNICAGIGRGQMTVVQEHIDHHKHVQALYEEFLKDVKGITMHTNPNQEYESNFWLCTATLDPDLRINGQENAYKQVITGAVGGAAGVTHTVATATTECQPNDNVEALRMALDAANIESRPLWKPMHRQPVYRNNPAYTNGVSESLFKVGICLPAGPWVTDDHVRYIVEKIKENIIM